MNVTNAPRHLLGFGLLLGLATLMGCADARPSIIPNPDTSLRKSSAQFAADAVKRHPYKADAPQGGEAVAGAQVGYSLDRLEIVNLSDETWEDVEVWVNRNWVVYLPKMEPKLLKRINFEMLFDDNGRYFPLDNSKILVNEVAILRNGKMYTVPCQQAD